MHVSDSPLRVLRLTLSVRPGAGWQRPIGLDNKIVVGDTNSQLQTRGCSSAGRAPDLHSGGRRFDPDQLHQFLGRARKVALLVSRKRWELRAPVADGPVAQLARAHP